MNRGLPTLLVAVTLCGMAQLAAAQAEGPVFSETQPLSRVLRVDDAMPTDIAGIRSHIDTNYHEDQKDQHGLPAFPSDRGPDKPKQPTDATPTHKVTFTGVLIVGEQATPGQNHRLVVWSDDGVDVRIDGQTVLARGEEMQKLEDESSSVHLVPETVALVPGEQYGVEIDYYNHYYTGAADWDGVTLFFVGGEGELAYGAAELELYDPNDRGASPWSVNTGDAGGTDSVRLRAYLDEVPSHVDPTSVAWTIVDRATGATVAGPATTTAGEFFFELSTATPRTYELLVKATVTASGGSTAPAATRPTDELRVGRVSLIPTRDRSDKVVSATIGNDRGTKLVVVRVSPGLAAGESVSVGLDRIAGQAGDAELDGADPNTNNQVKTLLPGAANRQLPGGVEEYDVKILGGLGVSDQPRNLVLRAAFDPGNGPVANPATFFITNFRVQLFALHSTTDTMPIANNYSLAGVNAFLEIRNAKQHTNLGYHIYPANGEVANWIVIEGRALPAAIPEPDFVQAANGAGFDWKQLVTTASYRDGVARRFNSANSDDMIDAREDRIGHWVRNRGDRKQYVTVYATDAPGFEGLHTLNEPNGTVYRVRQNFSTWVNYAGTPASERGLWWAHASAEVVGPVGPGQIATRDRTFDDQKDDDDDDDNNVGWGTHASLAVNRAAPGPVAGFVVESTDLFPSAGDTFKVRVVAADAQGHPVHNFVGPVTLARAAGTVGAAGPPKAGIFIQGTAAVNDDVINIGPGESGAATFTVVNHTVENMLLEAKSGASVGTSDVIKVQP